MVCAKCGAEIKVGNIYCSSCGKEAQIVPDYNIFEDELYQSLSQDEENKSPKASEENKHNHEVRQELNPKDPKKQKKRIIILSCILIVCIIVAVISGILVSKMQKNNSYDYQMEQARVCISDKKVEEAFTYLDRALEIEPASVETRVIMINAYVEQKDNESAIVLLKELLSLDEKNEMPYKLLIQLYEEDEAYEEIKALKDSVKDEKMLKIFEKYEVSAPVFSAEGGKHEEPIELGMNASGEQWEIYYTLDGSKPSDKSTLYEKPIPLEEGSYQIMAIAYNAYGMYGEVTSETYEIENKPPKAPTIQLKSGTYNEGGTIDIKVPENSEVYYTWDDTTPTKDSAQYTEPISIPEGNNILSAIAIGKNGKSSLVAKKNYIYLP